MERTTPPESMPDAKTPPATLLRKLAFIGPGMVLAALAIESGELVLTPRSGARFGFALPWVPVLMIVYKAAFSESLARLTIASGDDVFAAFDWLPGPRHWAQYFIIVVFSLDMIGYGGIALALGSALGGLFPGLDIRLEAVCATALVPLLLYTGSYDLFERIVVAMCAVRIAGVVYTLFHVPLRKSSGSVAFRSAKAAEEPSSAPRKVARGIARKSQRGGSIHIFTFEDLF